MKLIKVTKSGAIHYELDDGRIGATYPSGYVRVSTYGIGHYSKRVKFYQINKQKKKWYDKSKAWGFNIIRLKVNNHSDRTRLLLDFNNKNCK
ncbi:hypothetical protein DRO61_05855 [Candidatus Bathyarchaeota archaeon]|nr:MAG: hypothetical protein DRO61_05855 [Candidatus Bathyarchaeota archaeon]